MEPVTEKAFITIKDTARILSVSQATIFKLLRTGQLKRYKIGKASRICLGDLAEMMSRNQSAKTAGGLS